MELNFKVKQKEQIEEGKVVVENVVFSKSCDLK